MWLFALPRHELRLHFVITGKKTLCVHRIYIFCIQILHVIYQTLLSKATSTDIYLNIYYYTSNTVGLMQELLSKPDLF